ncbi:hypothetical protein B0H10DRAFT_1876702 [Mycena sp. CBHHK59/15]|nr:hypothetical protein B0H10DRAFT_1876702 [Mycena sp. CBHHK59/15]
MSGISGVHTIDVAGTKSTAFNLDPSKLPPGSVVIMDNRSGKPFVTTREEMDNAIPDRGPLIRPCGNCNKPPLTGDKPFAKCGKCKITHYCSRQCQIAHWKEHKPICKERVATAALLEKQKEAARLSGKRFVSPLVLQTWYRSNSDAIEYAAFHVLELYKGRAASLQPTHIAAFTVRVNEATPEDPELVRFLDVFAAPFSTFAQLTKMSETHIGMHKKACKNGFMTLYFLDGPESLQLIEFHDPPSSEPYTSGSKKPDTHWKINTMMKLNAKLPTAAT